MSDITLDEKEKNFLAGAKSEAGLYCTGCNNCIPDCKMNLPIPKMMRAYMYAYGYSDKKLACNLLTKISKGADPCGSCDVCSVTCSKRFNIKEKITDISRL